MSMEQAPAGVPEFDLADRMRKALRTSGVGVQEMAEYLGVARNTVSTWINGRIEPNRQTIRLWAMRTGVPFEWLSTGDYPQSPNGGLTGALPARSNTLSDDNVIDLKVRSAFDHGERPGVLRTTRTASA